MHLFYLELNDDALIRDIVSGVFTGSPETHDIQNLFPFSLIVSLLYRIIPVVPWFGIILWGLQLLSLVLIFTRAFAVASKKDAVGDPTGRKRLRRRTGVVVMAVLMTLLFIQHFTFVQYSVTTGFLAMAAVFMFITGEKGSHFAWGAALTGIAFIIRSEMLLLLSPFIVLSVIYAYADELQASRAVNEDMPGLKELISYPFKTEHYRKYGLSIVGTILIIAVGWGSNRIGYADTGWYDFVRFFDARTQVYDFTGVPAYEGNEKFYDEAGISPEEVTLLENYNFGLSDDIDADFMEKLASYASRGHGSNAVPGTAAVISDYLYRLRNLRFPKDFTWPQSDAPWNVIALLMYISAAVSAFLCTKNRQYDFKRRLIVSIWMPLLMFIMRSAIWIWLLSRGRAPVRITHPLYFVEISVLMGLILMHSLGIRLEVSRMGAEREEEPGSLRMKTVARLIMMVLVMAACVVYAVQSFGIIAAEEQKRAEANAPYEQLREYCSSYANEVYFLDVYSSVAETRPLFSELEKTGSPDNLDLLGGWAVKSPAWESKLDAFYMDGAMTGLLDTNSYFVARSDSDISWLSEYYASEGIDVTVKTIDIVADTFKIYSVREGDS